MLQLFATELPKDIKIVKDPHHNGASEWCFYKNNYWQRSGSYGTWTVAKKVHLTPKRVAALATLPTNLS